ncbi:MAG: peptide ABC transporter permease [Candidatus Infernicultor aquiphilus]|uniref:Peptide ABC transporter permease n=1 Tax=Candidatus Infernicultor aquiphilus TaxID=1805029 RepID=A0A1J5H6M2_9BACT|nr:MAG: peptide ABC transporter permease [Candidatus Atribacteria bacterium CG2_30_33_13]PIU24793.1 MAG: peptide ABC transporter permease [Candidatus Atribacteria bacterium CG08_land_8_20_14_0_20_33_29]PIW11487.1 MAG: peptide ABC transporter permease [Candidatus Atribacteria bacterium CG17_big_fil_post_rev_8_21_14_2_50_34_11]PIX33282.1 MAG: peptide ABC transporter permease [Candidatus Atribacteria bacterium CG_4_8_14_3_um_filter_34_18]PJB55779.1 MAG: peptide ABC transporter permease [Candidatus
MERKIETKTQELIRRLKYNKSALFGLVIVIIIVMCALLANYIAPNDPNPSPPQLANKLKPGFWSEKGIEGAPLGTDSLGRCVLSRIIYGSRVSLSAGFVAVGIAMILGITFGVIAGYYGGWVDALIMRIVDIMFAFPALLLAIVIVAVIGQGLDKAMIAIGIVYTPQMARIIRSSVLYIKEMEYIEIQKAMGSSDGRVIFRHVLPNSIAPVIVYGTLMLASAILDCAALGFLGLGAQPPIPEWGAMLSKSYSYIISGAWWAATFPGIAILFSVLGLNLLGDGLRDILDPRLKT